MATHTDPDLQRQVIYSVYVRAHTPEGTFRALMGDLDRIRALGVDIVWLMPIHPIGEQGKKGSLGCPYANRDYRSIHPAYGTMEDFRALVDAIHARGMKCIIDVVYNHTSPDSVLYAEHPEFFYRRPDGSPGNRVGDWTDVIDLDYGNAALWDYQIETLCMWAQVVDGFRCDVASFVPLAFWLRAREAVERVHPGCIWLAETVHRSFGAMARAAGMTAGRDTDLFAAFDIEYDYDVRECFDAYLGGKTTLSHYLDLLTFQEAVYPENYNKLRFLENHDQPRIASRIRTLPELENYTAMLYFLKGTTLLYAGQEFACTHLPSLFEREVFSRDTGADLSPLLQRLYAIKRQLGCEDAFFAAADDAQDVAVLQRRDQTQTAVGVFSLRAQTARVAVPLADGVYTDAISGAAVPVTQGTLTSSGAPIILLAPVDASRPRGL
ncbi:MAG: alpha-amylase [Oscillospiraceae bacterium]|nr:alpha-amylase [Oscillospiraceae bacterium]